MADVKHIRQREEADEGMSSQTQSYTPQWWIVLRTGSSVIRVTAKKVLPILATSFHHNTLPHHPRSTCSFAIVHLNDAPKPCPVISQVPL